MTGDSSVAVPPPPPPPPPPLLLQALACHPAVAARPGFRVQPDAPEILGDQALLLNNLAATLTRLGEPREARALYVRAAGLCELVLPADHPQTAHVRAKLQAIDHGLVAAEGAAQGEREGMPARTSVPSAWSHRGREMARLQACDLAAEVRQASLLARRELERHAAAHHERVLRPTHRPRGQDCPDKSHVQRELLASKPGVQVTL